MDKCYKEEGESSSVDMDTTRTKIEKHGHSLRFRYGFRKHLVTCNEPMTIQERLQTNFLFKAICKKNQEGKKEMVILREKPRAAVVPDFPCCLLEEDELLDIKFIKADGSSGPVKTPKLTVQSPEHLVSFYIKTRGAENIRLVMKNNELKKNVDEVCVCAVKGEKLKAALKRDRRFKGLICSKGALYEHETESMVDLSTLVDFLGGKHFEVIRCSPHQTGSQESSQEMSQESETPGVKDEKSEVPETPQATSSSQDSSSTREKKAETPQHEKTPTKKYPDTKKIPNTGEILNLLREQHKDLLQTLKEREKLKNNVEVKRFFREEYDKSAQSFTEVKKVKILMNFSDYVCQIRTDGLPKGTGFLLFDRFVLTNAHVVGDLIPLSGQMKHKLTAVFGFEDLDSVTKMELKQDVVAYFKGKDGMKNDLDFALLELSGDEKPDCPELLSRYSPPPTRGGVCIIGHPDGGVKRMDPCFMIAKEDRKRAAEEHYKNNPIPQVYHVITQQCLNEDRELHQSQIIYGSCFFHGSSGSPVFDEQCNLIGVHTGGYCYGEGKKKRSVMEYALPMLPILVQIYIQCHRSGRSDVVQHITSQNNTKYVVKVAEEQIRKNNHYSH